MQRKTSIISISVSVAALFVIVAIIGLTSAGKNNQTSMSNTSMTTTTASSNKTYKDGTYTGSGSYNSPGGEESIKITVTLANNVITDTSAVSGSTSLTSMEYQQDFIAAYKQIIVGKNINAVHLKGPIAGSSLTPIGFNLALKQIESQAS